MSFVDAARLTKDNIQCINDSMCIVYRRQKTKNTKAGNIKIVLSDKIKELLEWFDMNTKLIGNYLLPIVGVNYEEGEKLYNQITQRRCNIGVQLKSYCREIGADSKITFYSARHTFATNILRRGASIMDVKQSLGHGNIATTERYIGELDGVELSIKIQEML